MSTIKPRTLTAEEQTLLEHYLRQQRVAQDELRASGLTPRQLRLLGQMFHYRLVIRGILKLDEQTQAAAAMLPTDTTSVFDELPLEERDEQSLIAVPAALGTPGRQFNAYIIGQ